VRLHVRQETLYAYPATVGSSYNELRLLPMPAQTQTVVTARVHVTPAGYESEYRDYFGNVVRYLEIQRPHRELRIASEVVVDTAGGRLPAAGGRWAAEYLQAGELTRPDGPAAAELARLAGEDPHALLRAVHARLVYRPGVTGTRTGVSEALAGGAGVCQDFAHVYAAAARQRGWPTRYVGGYLLQDGPEAPHAAHAWVEVLVGGAWEGLDPTNDCPVDEHYLRVACGRDYADVPPVRGVYAGVAAGALHVRLEVASEGAGAQ
jgi:transglutaminase-like putative cysteine protease